MVVVKYVVVAHFCCDRNLLCVVGLCFPRYCLALVAYNKTNIPCPFCLISKLLTLGNIIFNSTYKIFILILNVFGIVLIYLRIDFSKIKMLKMQFPV